METCNGQNPIAYLNWNEYSQYRIHCPSPCVSRIVTGRQERSLQLRKPKRRIYGNGVHEHTDSALFARVDHVEKEDENDHCDAVQGPTVRALA